jgi:hypothetical protein
MLSVYQKSPPTVLLGCFETARRVNFYDSSVNVVCSFFVRTKNEPRKPPRNQPALRVPDPTCLKPDATLSLIPVLDTCLGSLLAGNQRTFLLSPSRFAKVVLQKVATSCGAVTAFLSATLGTRRAKIAGRLFFYSFFLREKKGWSSTDFIWIQCEEISWRIPRSFLILE